MRREYFNRPLSLYTEWYWQMDLKNMFHFLKLRMDSHAQWEIQEYGRAMDGGADAEFEGKLNK